MSSILLLNYINLENAKNLYLQYVVKELSPVDLKNKYVFKMLETKTRK